MNLTTPDEVRKLVSYSQPVFKIIIASPVSLAISVTAGLVTLKNIQQTSLTDQLRSVD